MLTRKDVIQAIVCPSTIKSFSQSQWNDLIIVLRHEKLLARFYLLLKDNQLAEYIPEPVLRHCENAETLASKQHMVVCSEINYLKDIFVDVDFKLLLLKGAAYVYTQNSASIGRVFSDIDVLVPKEALTSSESRLAIHGWLSKYLDDYDDKYYREWSHEVPPLQHGNRGTVLDLHHNLVPPVSGKAIDINLFLNAAAIEHNGVMVLTDAGMFFHSAIHLLFNDDFSASFRDMTDLRLLVSGQNDNFFETLFEIHKVAGFEKESFMALLLLKEEYDVLLPDWVITHILQSPIKITNFELALLQRVVGPKHQLLREGEQSFNHVLAQARGHYLKMPPHILVFHSSMKLFRAVTKLLFGEHIFTKATPPN